MYLEIYPDIIFILNFFIDFILLFLIKKVNRKSSSVRKLIAASAMGGAFAVMAGIFPWMNSVIRFFLLNVIAAIVMLTAAFGRMKIMELLKQIIALYMITYFTGGFINSIYYYTDIRERIIHFGNSIVFSNLSCKIVVFAALCLIPGVYLFLWLFRWHQGNDKETYNIELMYQNHRLQTKALMDTGNCLHDPICNKPVMVIEASLLEELLPEQALMEFKAAENLLKDNEFSADFKLHNDPILKLRFIPYQSIGKTRGIMIGVLLDKVLIYTGKETICNEKVTAAICDNNLSVKDDYHVLLHKELIG